MPTGETMRERTGWRSEAISRRHRLWGVELQATDIDSLMIEYYKEYDAIRPTGIIEYKDEHAQAHNPNNPQFIATAKLCTRADVPFYVVRYSTDTWQMHIIPINKWAKISLSEQTMSEEEFVRFQFKIRGYAENSNELHRALERLKNFKQTSSTSGQSSLF